MDVELPDSARDQVLSDPEYERWRSSWPTVEIDGQSFTVLRGDQLFDDDELIVEWIHLFRPHLLPGR